MIRPADNFLAISYLAHDVFYVAWKYIYNLYNATFFDHIYEYLNSYISYNERVYDVYTHIIHDTNPQKYCTIWSKDQPIVKQSLSYYFFNSSLITALNDE